MLELLTRRRAAVRPQVLLHQPGKVGSVSLRDSLRATAPELEVLHVHFMSSAFRQFFESFVHRPDVPDGLRKALVPHLGYARRGLSILERVAPSQVVVVSGFREPIAHGVSAFFQNLRHFAPSALDAERPLADRLAETRRAFRSAVDAALLVEERPSWQGLLAHWLIIGSGVLWFDHELWDPYRVDVYAHPMRGRDLIDYEVRGVRFLLYRFERFREVREEIVARITGRTPELVDGNVSQNKAYGDLLRVFREELDLPTRLRRMLLDADFTKHAYGSRLDAWLSPPAGPAHGLPLVGLHTSD